MSCARRCTASSGVTRLLHLEAGDRAVTRRLELIESSGTHLLGLINDLLDISRIEAGQFVMRSERFELGAVVQNLADLYTVRAVDKGLDFTLNLQLDPPCWVTGDPARVRQVLHNLLGNAVKFTQHGSITLTLMRDADSGRLSAEVQDTGPGIEASELVHVFEAFRQVGGAVSRPFEGTGLGLTIARDIAQAMGGDISMRSTVGVGTCALFTALLPTAAPVEADSRAGGTRRPGRGGRGCMPRTDRRGRRCQCRHRHRLPGAHGRDCRAREGRPPRGAATRCATPTGPTWC